MQEPQLRHILRELREELQRTETSDAGQRELLRHAIRDVEALLARCEASPEGAPGPEHQSLLERLREATREFEESHPALTSAAGRVIDALANLGI